MNTFSRQIGYHQGLSYLFGREVRSGKFIIVGETVVAPIVTVVVDLAVVYPKGTVTDTVYDPAFVAVYAYRPSAVFIVFVIPGPVIFTCVDIPGSVLSLTLFRFLS